MKDVERKQIWRSRVMRAGPNSFPNENGEIQLIITYHKVKDWNMWSDCRILPPGIYIGDRSFGPLILGLWRLCNTWDLGRFNGWILTMRIMTQRLIRTRICTYTKIRTRNNTKMCNSTSTNTRIETKTNTKICTFTRI